MDNQTNRSEKKGCARGGPGRVGASVDEEAVLRELEKANDILQTDPEVIDSMTMEDLQQEMKELGIAPTLMPEKLISAIRASGKKPSSDNNTTGTAVPEAVEGQAEGEAEDQESRPRTRVARAGGSNVISIEKNKKRHSFVQTEPVASRLPLIVRTAAVVVLAADIGPIFNWLIWRGLNEALVWTVPAVSASLTSLILTAMIGYTTLRGPEKIVNRSGFLSALGLTAGGGIIWMASADTRFEAAFAAIFTLLGVAVTVFLEQIASAPHQTRTRLLRGRAATSAVAEGWSLKAVYMRLGKKFGAVRNFWQQCGMLLLSEGRGPNWAKVGSAGFLICAATGGIAHWQYHKSDGPGLAGGSHIAVEVSRPGSGMMGADMAKNAIIAMQGVEAGTPGATRRARANTLRGETIVDLGQIGTVIVKLPGDVGLDLDKETLAVSLNAHISERLSSDGSVHRYLVITSGTLHQVNPVNSEDSVGKEFSSQQGRTHAGLSGE